MAPKSKSRKFAKIQLPDDIIRKILIPISVKNLARFRLVCKSWDSMISDPYFHQLHLNRSQLNPRLLALYGDGVFKLLDKKGALIEEFSPSIASLYHTLRKGLLMCSCLELVCFHSRRKIYVCNPTTKELLKFSKKDYINKWLVDDVSVGFGYVSSTKKYKVTRVVGMRCDVLTIGTDDNNWRPSSGPPFPVYGKKTTFANGALHILSSEYSCILHFDLEQEEWSVLPLPQPSVVPSSYLGIPTQLEGQFCLAEKIDEQDCSTTMYLRFLKDHVNNVWVTKYVVNTPWYNFSPLLTENDGKILMNRYYRSKRTCGYKLGYFDTNRNCWEELESPTGILDFAVYVESFLKLGSS